MMKKIVPVAAAVAVLVVIVAVVFLKPKGGQAGGLVYQELNLFPADAPQGSVVVATLKVGATKPGTYEVKIRIGDWSDSKTVTFENVEEVQLVSFNYYAGTIGSFQVSAGDLPPQTLNVRQPAPAAFKVLSIEVPAQAVKGTTVKVTALVQNRGEVEGSYVGRLMVAGQVVRETPPQPIGPGASKSVVFSFTVTQNPGKYNIELENYVGSAVYLNVVEAKAEFEKTGLAVPAKGYTDEPVEVTLTVKNVGNIENYFTFTLDSVEPSVGSLPSKSLKVKPGEEKSYTLPLSLSKGTYTLTFGDHKRTITVEEPSSVRVKEIKVPDVALLLSEVPVKVKVFNSSDTTGEFTGTLEVKIGEETIFSQSVSISGIPARGESEKEYKIPASKLTKKGLCTVTLEAKAKSFKVLGLDEVYLPGDWVEYQGTTVVTIPELGIDRSEQGKFKLVYEGTTTREKYVCRKFVRQSEEDPTTYDELYTPDTDKEGYLYQALSYLKGELNSEVNYDDRLLILRLPLTVGEINATSGPTWVVIRNKRPIQFNMEGMCTVETKVEGTETKSVAGQPVETIKLSIKLTVNGTATVMGQTAPVTSTTIITRWVNRMGIAVEEIAIMESKTSYMGKDITIHDETRLVLLNYQLSNLSTL
jgi:hypothetical protein